MDNAPFTVSRYSTEKMNFSAENFMTEYSVSRESRVSVLRSPLWEVLQVKCYHDIYYSPMAKKMGMLKGLTAKLTISGIHIILAVRVMIILDGPGTGTGSCWSV